MIIRWHASDDGAIHRGWHSRYWVVTVRREGAAWRVTPGPRKRGAPRWTCDERVTIGGIRAARDLAERAWAGACVARLQGFLQQLTKG